MKLDCLLNAEQGKTIIRVYDFTTDEASRLVIAIQNLACERETDVDVHAMSGVSAIGGCQLTLRLKRHDQSTIEIEPSKFECGFTAGTWDNVAGLMEPFTRGAGGFQWLAGSPGEAPLLLSVTGQW
jgi:hypothetical protein